MRLRPLNLPLRTALALAAAGAFTSSCVGRSSSSSGGTGGGSSGGSGSSSGGGAPDGGPSCAAYTAGLGPTSVAVGDFNGDGKPDLVVVNAGDNINASNVSVFMNQGGGAFAPEVTYAVGIDPWSVAVGDLNGDGKPDLAVVDTIGASGSNGTISVLLNKGVGTFAAQVTYAVGEAPYSVAVGDLNGDGKPDLAVANSVDNTVGVLLNDGKGTFAAQVAYPVGSSPHSVAMGDFNGDGKLDLAVVNNGNGGGGQGGNTVSVLLNAGGGAFSTQVIYPVGIAPISVAVGDFNGDGKPDLAVANNSDDTVSVLLNVGAGTFAGQVAYPVGSGPLSVAVGDFNGDGRPDLATANWDDFNASVLLNVGGGGFGAQTTYAAGENPCAVATGDFNGGNASGLAVANRGGSVSVLLDGCNP